MLRRAFLKTVAAAVCFAGALKHKLNAEPHKLNVTGYPTGGTFIAGEDLDVGQVVYFGSDGKVYQFPKRVMTIEQVEQEYAIPKGYLKPRRQDGQLDSSIKITAGNTSSLLPT